FKPARISSRNFCGIFCRCAILAILTGSPGPWVAKSKMACSAYSPFTEMFMEPDGGIPLVQVEIVALLLGNANGSDSWILRRRWRQISVFVAIAVGATLAISLRLVPDLHHSLQIVGEPVRTHGATARGAQDQDGPLERRPIGCARTWSGWC